MMNIFGIIFLSIAALFCLTIVLAVMWEILIPEEVQNALINKALRWITGVDE